ncbi:hypothetical protein D5086_029862 [Populus alba]|uniref:Uncharacterized protein n=1 Tax=Populus alba TaxID=43335 RepID=A0ACC4AUS8_POPAL
MQGVHQDEIRGLCLVFRFCNRLASSELTVGSQWRRSVSWRLDSCMQMDMDCLREGRQVKDTVQTGLMTMSLGDLKRRAREGSSVDRKETETHPPPNIRALQQNNGITIKLTGKKWIRLAGYVQFPSSIPPSFNNNNMRLISM